VKQGSSCEAKKMDHSQERGKSVLTSLFMGDPSPRTLSGERRQVAIFNSPARGGGGVYPAPCLKGSGAGVRPVTRRRFSFSVNC
jgi:hypothetical protein